MILHSFGLKIPPYVSPIITFGTVGYFFYKSRIDLKQMGDDISTTVNQEKYNGSR